MAKINLFFVMILFISIMNFTSASSPNLLDGTIGLPSLDTATPSNNTYNVNYTVTGEPRWDANYSLVMPYSAWNSTNTSYFDLNKANSVGAFNQQFDTDTFFINSASDRIGIGTISPNTTLNLFSTDAPEIRFSDDSDGNYSFIKTNTGNQFIIGTSGASDPMRFFTGNIERMKIGENGRIGINTTNPLYPLDVNLTNNIARFTDGVTASAIWTVLGGFGSSVGKQVIGMTGTTDFEIRSGSTQYGSSISGTTRFVVQDDGNVGVGSTAPQNTFNVIGSGNFTTGFILGSPTSSINLTMYSPNGTSYSCGVRNGGAWSCV